MCSPLAHRACSTLLLALFVSAASLVAQQQPLTLETALTRGATLLRPSTRVVWSPTGHGGALILAPEQGPGFALRLDDSMAAKEPLFSASDLRRATGVVSIYGKRLPPWSFVDDDTIRFEHEAVLYHWQLPGNARTRRKAARMLHWPAGSQRTIAPGDGHAAYLHDGDLWLTSSGGDRRRLTHDGSADIVYCGAAHRAEFGITTGWFWSPSGRYLAFSREDLRPIAPYPYQDLGAIPPRPVHGRYPMAGRAHSRVTIGVCDATTGATHWLEHDPAADVYWTNLAVRDDGAVFVVHVNRGQDHLELVRYEPDGKKGPVLLREFDAEWIEPEHPVTFLPAGELLWWSSRDGYRHLYALGPDGKVRRQLTKGEFDVQRLIALGDEALWFEASGDDPRERHVFTAALDGSGQEQLTSLRGCHRATVSADLEFAHITWSSVESPPSSYFVELDSRDPIQQVAQKHPITDYRLPEHRFFDVQTKTGDKLHGEVYLPPGRQPDQRHPVLLYVYGGPHAQLVKNEFSTARGLWLQALAAEGYVVCRLDNRGTPNRGIEFEQRIFRRLGTVEVDDQLLAVKWLKQQPFVDPDRIAVHGWSFGGYMTLRLMLLAPETFACGISGAPVTDWAMYETGYTERYMDTPDENPEGYELSSCLPLAGELQRPLLLVHGTDDRTVMWSHTLRFVEQCIEHGTDLEYLPYPGQLHGLRGNHRADFLRRLRRFLHRHLGAPTAAEAATNK
ncbi:MAG: prolyl oligopeptidase family serine peptidase [bacterium]|nr:prolyl oligopeptidase family serine peptidase [bacterium]